MEQRLQLVAGSATFGNEIDFRFMHTKRGVRVPKPTNDIAYLTTELHTTKELYTKVQSSFQRIEVWATGGVSFIHGYKTESRGLYLDDVLQLDTDDEYVYHEALVHPVMMAHPEPKHVAVLGGGDGGALREVLKHNTIQSASLIEIDRMVIDLCDEYLPDVNGGAFHDPRTKIIIADVFQWIANYSRVNTDQNPPLDVIIVDLLDLTVDSELIDFLFSGELIQVFMQNLRAALSQDGVIVVQMGEREDVQHMKSCLYDYDKRTEEFGSKGVLKTGCKGMRRQFLFLDIVRQLFDFTHVMSVFVPSFLGEWTFVVASQSSVIRQNFLGNDERLLRVMKQRFEILATDGVEPNDVDSAHASLLVKKELAFFTHSFMQQSRIVTWDEELYSQMRESLAQEHQEASASHNGRVIEFLERRMAEPIVSKVHHCEHLQVLRENDLEHPGYEMRYVLAASSYGSNNVGVHTLQDIKKGQVIWRFHDESVLGPLTSENFEVEMKKLIAKRPWQNGTDIDALARKVGLDSDLLIRAYVSRYWINDFVDLDSWNSSIYVGLSDERFVNYGTTTLDQAAFRSYLEDIPVDLYWRGRLQIATGDIEACEELLEDYFYWDEGDFPPWYERLLNSYPDSVKNDFYWPAFRYLPAKRATHA